MQAESNLALAARSWRSSKHRTLPSLLQTFIVFVVKSAIVVFVCFIYLCFVYWHCPRSTRSRVYVTVGCLSVRLFIASFDRRNGVWRVCCWASRQQEISIDSGGRWASSSNSAAARGRSTALSSKCRQCHVDSQVIWRGWIKGRLVFIYICLYVCKLSYEIWYTCTCIASQEFSANLRTFWILRYWCPCKCALHYQAALQCVAMMRPAVTHVAWSSCMSAVHDSEPCESG